MSVIRADRLAQLYDAIRQREAFDYLHYTIHTGSEHPFVPGRGSIPAKLMVLGEAPGAQESIQGKPFVGPCGAVLRRMLDIAGIVEAECWITNVLKWRPPRNRTPTTMEVTNSREYIWREWSIVGKPRIVVALGTSALSLLTYKQGILKHAGAPIPLTGSRVGVTVWPMAHPAYGLRNPSAQSDIEEDWRKFGAWLSENSA